MEKENVRWKWADAQKAIADRYCAAYGWDKERALQAAEIASDALRRKYGGERYYIPNKNRFFKERIRNEFDGRNIVELSRKYGISAKTVREYLK